LKRSFEIAPLACARCGGQMRIVSFIVAPDLIAVILRHLRGKGYSAR
jgi:hypothetical protein